LKKSIKDFIRRNRLIIIFAVIGLAVGFAYWKFVGCLSGICPVKSVWYWSTLYGGLIGYLLGGLFQDFIKRYKDKSSVTHYNSSN
jgi:phosphate/sulfate permease